MLYLHAEYRILLLCFQAASKVEVDPEAGTKLRVMRADFLHSLEKDVKPISNLQILMFLVIS